MKEQSYVNIMKLARAAAEKMFEEIDNTIIKRCFKKKMEESGYAICLNACEFMNDLDPPDTLKFKAGRLYKYRKWQYYSDNRIEVDVWKESDEKLDVRDYRYMVEITEEIFKKNFREFI
jgi:hypothetical protein